MFDLSAFGLSDSAQAAILQGAVVASAVLPLAEKLLGKNKVLSTLASVLKCLPRVRLGK